MPLPKFSALLPTPDTTGDFEEMYLVASESAGLVKDIKPAGQIVREMMDEAGQIIEHRLTSTTQARLRRDTSRRKKLDISYLMLKEKQGCPFSVSSQQYYRFNSESQDILVFSKSTFLLGEIVFGLETAASRRRFHDEAG